MHGSGAVAGIGESTYYKRGASPYTEFQLACIAIRRAVEDAGLGLADVDGFVSFTDQRNTPLRLARALGLKELRWTGIPWAGGGNSMAAAVQIADAAVSAGYARHVVVFRALAQGQFGRFGQAGGGGGGAVMTGPQVWNATYGILTPAHQCALHTARFMHDHGISQEALCEIAFACYANAQRNPRALRRGEPLTREAYHASRWVVTPFHLYDCCPENDGAAAAVVTTIERARDLRHRPATIVAAASGIGPQFGAFDVATLGSAHYRQVGTHLWEQAGCGPQDVDVAQFYENFTGPVLMALCEMGFTSPAGLEEFVSGGRLVGPDAALPFNTSGGNLGEAYIHGFEMINESVRQIRGESTCQVENVERALVVAGPGYAPGSAVLFGAPGMTRVLGDTWALPSLDARNRDFFTAGVLALQQCTRCGHVQHPPEDVCEACGSFEFGHFVSAGNGRIESAAGVTQAVHPLLADRVPYAIVLVSVADAPGILVAGNVVGKDPEAVAIGDRVQVVFEEARDPRSGDVLRIPQWQVVA